MQIWPIINGIEKKPIVFINISDVVNKTINLCKQRGWNINELTTGQLLFILSQPEIKNLK